MCDLILHNARAITMDPAQPLAGLVAIRGDKIVAVADEGSLSRFNKPGTRVVNCAGKTLLPGFIDAHCHLRAYAESLVSLKLSPRGQVSSISSIRRKIRDVCREKPPGTWIRAQGYDEFHLAEKRHPNRRDLDAAAPLHPVKLTHRSGHAHVLNSLALQQVGITAETGDPPGGLIGRDLDSSEPTGLLYGMSEYLSEKIPPLDETELRRGVALVNDKLLSYGITSVQDASSSNDRHRWEQFAAWKTKRILTPRVSAMVGLKHFAAAKPDLPELGIGETELRFAGVKIIAEQVTGSLNPCREELNEAIAAIHQAGFQAAVHAVEAPVIEAVCGAVEHALKLHPRQDARHRVEHCSVCPPALLKRLSALGIYVVTQPSFVFFSGERYLKTVPADDLENLYPIGSMVREGLRVGFSSDFPLADPDPLIGIQAAVTRAAESECLVRPEQGISLSDALRLYTLGAAAAAFEEPVKGSIAPGKLADLVLLSEDLSTIAPARIKDTQVEMTVLGGRIVRENPKI